FADRLPRVVDQDIDRAEAILRLLKHAPYISLLRNIAAGIGDLPAIRELGHCLLQGLNASAHQRYAGPHVHQSLGNGIPDSARAARHQCMFAFKVLALRHFPIGCAYAAARSKLVSNWRLAGKYCLGQLTSVAPMRADSRNVQAASAR